MAAVQPISTAPTDGTKVRVMWRDADGAENESLARYRSPDRLRGAGGDWDETDGGWWVFVDSNTQKKIEPHGWIPSGGDEDDA